MQDQIIQTTSHDQLLQTYDSGEGFDPFVRSLMCMARSLLDRTKIVRKLSTASMLRTKADKFKATCDNELTDEWVELFAGANDCYEEFIDDLLLLSAFELFAKAELLNNRYVVHEIRSPKSLGKLQQSDPISVEKFRGEKAKIKKDRTVGVDILSKPAYRKLCRVPDDVDRGLQEVRFRRNIVHFHIARSFTLTKDLLAAVKFLDESISISNVKEKH